MNRAIGVFLTVLFVFVATVFASEEKGGFLFVTFRGEGSPMTEQIYFMVSRDGSEWKALNNGEPALVSTVGEKGVRDPYIIRSHDNSKFYLIATDLSMHFKRDWGKAVTVSSKCVVIWESEDLVKWSEPKLVQVAPDDAGCAWAPEIVYDQDKKQYMIFWASTTGRDEFKKHRIWAVNTSDFETFSEPFIYIEKPTTIIDTTIVNDNGTYYRFTKDEKYKAITMEKSKHLMDGWEGIEQFSLSQMKGYEGPACFVIEPAAGGKSARWCLLLDWYARGKGYQAYITEDLSKGNFVEGEAMKFPFHPVRHGSVMPITCQEMNRLLWNEME